jgi:replicative DNA helicase
MANKIVLPEAQESEAVVVGSLLIEGTSAMKKIAHILSYKDFYNEAYRLMYRAAERLYIDGKDIDTISVIETLKQHGYLDKVGGPSEIVTVSNAVTNTMHIVTHAKIVAHRSTLRNIIWASKDIIEWAQTEEDLDQLLAKSEDRLKGVTRSSAHVENKLATVDLEEWRRIARDSEVTEGKVRGLSTGYKGLDGLLEGFEPGEMLILTGHTKHGKSRLATNIAYNVAQQGKDVLYVNTEMTKLQTARRFNSIAGTEDLKGHILLNDRTDIDYRDVIHIIERAKERGCDLVIVDHLHFFSRSVDNQTNEISKITKEFKEAAVQYDIPLLLLCHVQQGDTRKRPTLQMLKNSSSIAQDADIVITVWMDDRPDGDKTETEVLRLAHRSATKHNSRVTMYNDGMRLVEQRPAKSMDYNPNQILGEKDDDFDNFPWSQETSGGGAVNTRDVGSP